MCRFVLTSRQLFVSLALVLLAFAAAPSNATPPARETFGVSAPPRERPKKQVVHANVVRRAARAAAPEIRLEPLSDAALAYEDEQRAALSKVARFGVGRDVAVSPESGAWLAEPDGRTLWACEIVAAGALGVRVHLLEIELPPSGSLRIYDPSDPAIPIDQYTGRGPLNAGEAWSSTIWNERVRIEYEPPVGVANTTTTPFRIDRIQHVYRHPSELLRNDLLKQAGPCHNDVTCFAALADLSRAVAGIGFIGDDSLFCTGQLINTLATDLTPYWLTANHCLSTGAEARSAEIFWLFQTATCNGAAPSLGSVPTSAVCTLLQTSAVSDFTLLMVEGALPEGLFWAGWTAGEVANGTDAVCIHHPMGDFKRVSFGFKGTNTSCGDENFVTLNWTDGPTEPGSSGSGCFREDNLQLFGQLFCGESTCGLETTDDFGSFAVTFDSVEDLLQEGSDDTFEDNDECDEAVMMGNGTFEGLVVKSLDEDWYRIRVPGGDEMSVMLEFTHVFGDIEMELLDACSGDVVASSTTSTDFESFTFENDGATAEFLLHIFLDSDTRNEYTLMVDVPSIPNNDLCTGAEPVGDGEFPGTNVNSATEDEPSCGGTADVWWLFTAPVDGTAVFEVCDSDFDTKLAVLDECGGNELACDDDSCGTRSSVTLDVEDDEDYLVRVSGKGGATGHITLRITTTGEPPANNDCADAIAVGDGDFTGSNHDATDDGSASCGGSADVWWRYTAPLDGTAWFDTAGTSFDSKLAVFDGCGGTELACASNTADDGSAVIDMDVMQGDVLLLRVSGAGGAGGDVHLSIMTAAPDPCDDLPPLVALLTCCPQALLCIGCSIGGMTLMRHRLRRRR